MGGGGVGGGGVGGGGVGAIPTGEARFGNFVVDVGKLNREHVLSVKHLKSRKKVHEMANTSVTPQFKEVMHKVLAGGGLTTATMDLLPAGEKDLMKRLVKRSRADLELEVEKSEEPLTRLKIMLGEIEAGNDSQLLRDQLEAMVQRLQVEGVLTAELASQIRQSF